ncbi:MAG: hypothetical protein IH588_16015 [Anaerolineales bacterium]|nr:hypothetical protein [Anaerolineales bacterium]
MKALRAVLSLLIGFIASYFLAVTFFHLTNFSSPIDRLFLIVVPALAIGILLFEKFPAVLQWALRIRARYSLLHYLIGFLLGLNLTYGAVGFLNEPLRTPFGMILFTAAFITFGSVAGYHLVRRVSFSLDNGFLSKPINFILALSLPLLFIAVIYAGTQFPSMFVIDYVIVPQKWLALFIITALAAGLWSLSVLEKIETGGYYEKFVHTKFYEFFSQNLPGLYAGGMFFLINLIIARALNHPALSINSVLFEADAGPWMTILASPESDVVNRSVHPLTLLIIRPLVRLVAGFMGEHWNLGGMITSAAVGGLCVFMAWLFVKRATRSRTYAFIFSILLGTTATHLLFGSLTENYIFGAAALIFFFLLIQADEKRFAVLVPAGWLLFGITITNIVQGVIALFFNKFGFRRLLQYTLLVLASGVLLTTVTSALYPDAQTFFFVPADLAFEFNFVKTEQDLPAASLAKKIQVVTRTMFLYDAVGPSPIEAISKKPPFHTIDLKTFDIRENRLASYKGLGNIPLTLWVALLAGSFLVFIKNIRSSNHLSLMLGLLGTLAFNFLLHLFYGTELFLYTSYWMYALVFFISLALAGFAEKIWLQTALIVVVLALMINNFWFIFTVIRGLAPFYAAVP